MVIATSDDRASQMIAGFIESVTHARLSTAQQEYISNATSAAATAARLVTNPAIALADTAMKAFLEKDGLGNTLKKVTGGANVAPVTEIDPTAVTEETATAAMRAAEETAKGGVPRK